MSAEPPGWVQVRCPLCRGTGCDMPADDIAECARCQGNGGYWRHKASGMLALWPGGPFIGRRAIDFEEGA